MSRVGKMPIPLPAGVEVLITAEKITVKGSQGALSLSLTGQVVIKNEDNTLNFSPADESREANAMSGTVRALVNNMVNGVSKGFEKKLALVGVGYR
ncbi:MAG: 50S ribosomal protein L6, partial [bacterium]